VTQEEEKKKKSERRVEVPGKCVKKLRTLDIDVTVLDESADEREDLFEIEGNVERLRDGRARLGRD
jgi:hypothetical protein